jgi:hypothetical protein
MTPSLPTSDLVETLRAESRSIFPERMRDGHAYHSTARALDKAAAEIDRLNALLGEREAAIKKVVDYYEGNKPFDFFSMPRAQRAREAADAWQEIVAELRAILTKLGEGR